MFTAFRLNFLRLFCDPIVVINYEDLAKAACFVHVYSLYILPTLKGNFGQ